MAVLGEKLGGGPADRLANMLRILLGALFLRSSRVRPTLFDQRTSGVRGLVQETYMACVPGFPCRVYIDSNRRDSHI
jgi:hypothetical protein